MQHTLKKGDTGKPLVGILKDTNDTTGAVERYAIPAGSTLNILMTTDNGTVLKVNAACSIDADQILNPGKFTYNWQNADVDTAGAFDLELLLTLPNSKKIRWPRTLGETFGTVYILPAKS